MAVGVQMQDRCCGVFLPLHRRAGKASLAGWLRMLPLLLEFPP